MHLSNSVVILISCNQSSFFLLHNLRILICAAESKVQFFAIQLFLQNWNIVEVHGIYANDKYSDHSSVFHDASQRSFKILFLS